MRKWSGRKKEKKVLKDFYVTENVIWDRTLGKYKHKKKGLLFCESLFFNSFIICQLWKNPFQQQFSDQLFRTPLHNTSRYCAFLLSTNNNNKKDMMGNCLARKKHTEKEEEKKKKRFCCFSHIFHTFSWKLLAAWQVPHFSLIPPSSSENNIYSIRSKKIQTYTHTHSLSHTHTLNKKSC